ncbi:MAG: translation initiation factor IF-2 [Patescibacteria group bacterium]
MIKHNKKENNQARPPIVVILGHVDHGKTTLLDYIRKTKVTEMEAGGITQHIAAYQIEHKGKKITFIDTPGHEAFNKMRSRGVKIADIAVLVVAAEEGVKPQTLESINYIKEADIPYIVALNKVDKPEANQEKVKKDLSQHNVLIEEWGGEVPLIPISAKTGNGVPELLEMIQLVAEMEDLQSEQDESFEGVLVEAFMDKERGPTVSLISKKGILRKGDKFFCGDTNGSAKILEDFQGNSVEAIFPSMPIRIIGLSKVPEVGEKCFLGTGEEIDIKDKKTQIPFLLIGNSASVKTVHLILKADANGSLEAMLSSLEENKSQEIAIEVLKAEIGEINETDIKMAGAGGAVIVSFNLDTPVDIKSLAARNDIKIIPGNIIYELIDQIKKEMSLLLEVENIRTKIGELKVLAIFRTEKQRMIVGGKIINGFMRNKAEVEVLRGGEIIAKGKIIQLKKEKQIMDRVDNPNEAGILFEGNPVIQEGDVLGAFVEEKTKKSL